MNKIKVDSNTMALVTWINGILKDAVGKFAWTTYPTSGAKTYNDSVYHGGTAWYQASGTFPKDATIEGWYYWDGAVHGSCGIFGAGASTGGSYTTFYMGTWHNGKDVELDLLNYNTGLIPVKVGWNHVAIVRQNGLKHSIYVNGVKSGNEIDHELTCQGLFWIARNPVSDKCSMGEDQRLAIVRFSDCVRYTENFDPQKVFPLPGGGQVQ